MRMLIVWLSLCSASAPVGCAPSSRDPFRGPHDPEGPSRDSGPDLFGGASDSSVRVDASEADGAMLPDPPFLHPDPSWETRPWTTTEHHDFNHGSTGGRLIPQDWFVALEFPDRDERWVDVPSELESRVGVPIDPATGTPFGLTEDTYTDTYASPFEATGRYVGVNCAFCHTGEIHYEGERLLLPGGSGRTSLVRFLTLLRESLSTTAADVAKFWRFWGSVTTYNITPQELYAALGFYVTLIDQIAVLPNVDEGYGRLDTTSMGASAFSYYDERNRTSLDAPVSIPALWGTHRYAYRHYSGSIRLAIARDIMATIGGGVGISLEPGPDQYKSTIDIEALHRVEWLLSVLAPPVWPADMLGEIDDARAARGQEVYREQCASCHEGTSEPAELSLTMVGLELLGTDPVSARKLNETTLYLDSIGIGTLPAAQAFQIYSSEILENRFRALGFTDERRHEYMEGGRPNEWRAPLAYRAAPLDGIWATPPFLHNGSVPTLYDLLLPPGERPSVFRVCPDTEYDPVRVGLVAEEARSRCPVIDTSDPGNRNGGHSYGVALGEEDRLDLIEYLKVR